MQSKVHTQDALESWELGTSKGGEEGVPQVDGDSKMAELHMDSCCFGPEKPDFLFLKFSF